MNEWTNGQIGYIKKRTKNVRKKNLHANEHSQLRRIDRAQDARETDAGHASVSDLNIHTVDR